MGDFTKDIDGFGGVSNNIRYAVYDSKTYPVMDSIIIRTFINKLKFARSPQLAVRAFTNGMDNDTFKKAVLLPYIKIMAVTFKPYYSLDSFSSGGVNYTLQKEAHLIDYDKLIRVLFENSYIPL